MFSNFNINDIIGALVVSALATVGMIFLTRWLTRKKRSREFLAAVWGCFVLVVLVGVWVEVDLDLLFAGRSVFSAPLRPTVFLPVVFAAFFGGVALVARFRCSRDDQAEATRVLEEAILQLTEAKQAADVAVRAKGHFLANMSHEIRTPMNAVLGFADILGRRLMECCPDDQRPENARTIALIEKSGSDLLTIINDILDFSKVDADQIDLEWIPTSPRHILEDVRHLMFPKLDEKPNLKLTIRVDDDVPPAVFCDPTRLRQILVNLAGNAIKFSDRGEILIHGKMSRYPNDADARDRIRARYGEGVDLGPFEDEPEPESLLLLRFVVRDPGIGMSEPQIERLFQPFSQADSSLTRRFGGTGLGLSISRRLARLLGGDIVVRSEEGRGSKFTLTLVPRIAAASALTAYSGVFLLPNNEKPLQGLHFLLVEDGKVNQIVISAQLKEAGATVEIAENGQIAVDLVAEQPDGTFDVILMDMQMPVLDGYEATRILRERAFKQPIIAVTAHALSGDCDKTLQVGCNAYITKPIDRNRLIDMILQLDASACAIG